MTDLQVRLDPKSHEKLETLAAKHGRKLKAQIAVVIEDAYRAEFDVVAVDELPKPEGAEGVPLVYIQKRDPA